MKTGGWYNGYDAAERAAKLKELRRRIACGEQPLAAGPCDLCGDPGVSVEYHDEDYSQPYLWCRPAIFCLCRTCHRQKLHGRFSNPSQWLVFLAHVRRGGYARDLKERAIKKELARYRAAMEQGKEPSLQQLRPYRDTPGGEWFSALSLDLAATMSSRMNDEGSPVCMTGIGCAAVGLEEIHEHWSEASEHTSRR